MRLRALGTDPAKGYSPIEESQAQTLERKIGKQLVRSEHVGADWIDPQTGRTYDAIGTGPEKYFDLDSFKDQLRRHVREKGNDMTVVDLSQLTGDNLKNARAAVGELAAADGNAAKMMDITEEMLSKAK
jgi:hypothetical protein